MSNLHPCKLGDVIKFGNGKARPLAEGNIPVYGGNGVLGYANDANYEGETIIIGRVGAYCGATYYESAPIWVSDNALSAKPKENNNLKYLFYFLKHLDLNQLAQGSSHPLLTQGLLNSIDIEIVADAEEQKSIASILSSLDDKIDLLHRQNKTLEAMAETLFRQWFVEGAREDWEEIPIGRLFEISSGRGLDKTALCDAGLFPVLGANGEIGRSNSFLFNEKLIFTGRVGTLGNIFIVNGEKVWLSDNTLVFRNIRWFYFLYFTLKSARLADYNAGSTQPLIRQSDIKDIAINLPSEELLVTFEEISEINFKKIEVNKNHIRTLEKLRDTLLPKLMSGEVRVS